VNVLLDEVETQSRRAKSSYVRDLMLYASINPEGFVVPTRGEGTAKSRKTRKIRRHTQSRTLKKKKSSDMP
jgi:hypothetical protein